MNRLIKILCLGALLYAPCIMADTVVEANAETEIPQEAYLQFVRQLGDDAIATLTSKEISEEERKIRFEKVFNESFAVKSIAQFVLGHYRRRATTAEKAEFLSLFKRTISDIYASRFRKYTNETFNISYARPLGKKGMRVRSEILRAGAAPVVVEWKIYKTKQGTLKVFDVIVERISMSTTQRAEFASIIQQNGGTVSGLNAALLKKLDN